MKRWQRRAARTVAAVAVLVVLASIVYHYTLVAIEGRAPSYFQSTGGVGRVPRGRSKIEDFRDDEALRVSNHLTPRVKPVKTVTKPRDVSSDNDQNTTPNVWS